MKYIFGTLAAVLLAVILFFNFIPAGRAMINNYKYGMQKVDDNTLYETRKKVEDEARMMVASYSADKIRYEQYNASTDKEQISWGEQAKMRANQTASVYNSFILKNSFVFEGNIPDDILKELPILP